MAYCHGHTKGDMRVFPIEVILTDDTKIRKASEKLWIRTNDSVFPNGLNEVI